MDSSTFITPPYYDVYVQILPNKVTSDIYVMGGDGSRPWRLMTNLPQGPNNRPSPFVQEFGGVGAFDPAWSPDGTKIAFTSLRDNKDSEIYIIDVDGTGAVLVTDHVADESSAVSYFGYLGMRGGTPPQMLLEHCQIA